MATNVVENVVIDQLLGVPTEDEVKVAEHREGHSAHTARCDVRKLSYQSVHVLNRMIKIGSNKFFSVGLRLDAVGLRPPHRLHCEDVVVRVGEVGGWRDAAQVVGGRPHLAVPGQVALGSVVKLIEGQLLQAQLLAEVLQLLHGRPAREVGEHGREHGLQQSSRREGARRVATLGHSFMV